MDHKKLREFRIRFEKEKQQILLSHRVLSEDFTLKGEDLPDEMDLSSAELEQSVRMRLKNRESLYLKKIDDAIERIRTHSFGMCQDCGDEIELKRLEARPTTTLCVYCKERQEKFENFYIDHARSG